MEGHKKSFRKITVQYCNHHHLKTTFQTWHRNGGRIRVLKDGGDAGQDDRTSPGVAAGKKHFSLSFRLVLSLPCHKRNCVERYCVTRVPLLLLSNLVRYQLISVICIGSSAILYWSSSVALWRFFPWKVLRTGTNNFAYTTDSEHSFITS